VSPAGGPEHRPDRNAGRALSLRHPGPLGAGGRIRPVPGRHLQHAGGARPGEQRLSCRGGQGRTDRGELRSTGGAHCGGGAHRPGGPSRRGRHRIPGERARRPALFLRHQRAFQFRRRPGARGGIRSHREAGGLPGREGERGASMSLRFGYWLPVCCGVLRNVEDENMAASWEYVRDLAVRSEVIGFDLTLLAELNLNDIKGPEAPALDAWSTAAALAAVTRRLELMVAVRPNFHHPGLLAKQAANIDRIAAGRLSLNVVSSWWKDEATQYGLPFDEHEAR